MAQSSHASKMESGGMFCISLEKRFNKYFMMQVQQHLWLDDNFRHLERYMPVADFRITLWDNYLFFDALYFYRYQCTPSGESKNTNRYQLGLCGGHKWGHVGFNAYSRFESNYIKVGAELPYNRCYWRNRLQVNGYLKKGCKWSPYGAIEVFNTMNWPGENGVERLWFDLGATYGINKTFSMDFKIREIIPTLGSNEDKLHGTYFGVGCMIRL